MLYWVCKSWIELNKIFSVATFPETGSYHQFVATVTRIYGDDQPSKFEGTSLSDKPKYHSKASTVLIGILSKQSGSNPSIATVHWTCSPAQVALREQHEQLDVSLKELPAIWWVCFRFRRGCLLKVVERIQHARADHDGCRLGETGSRQAWFVFRAASLVIKLKK